MAEPSGDALVAFIRKAPIEAVKALLGRLSPKDILRMRSICKAWRDELCALLTRLYHEEPLLCFDRDACPGEHCVSSDYGVVECLDLRSGKTRTVKRLSDNHYYFVDEDYDFLFDGSPKELGKAEAWSGEQSAEAALSSSPKELGKAAARSAQQRAEAAPASSQKAANPNKRGLESVSDDNAAAAAAALMPYDFTGKKKKYKAWQTELRSAIAGYFPEGMPMKISHDSTFRQIAGVIKDIRGTTVEVAHLPGEEALRQVLPPGTAIGRGDTAVYCAALKFLSS